MHYMWHHGDTYIEHVCVKVNAGKFVVNISSDLKIAGKRKRITNDTEM